MCAGHDDEKSWLTPKPLRAVHTSVIARALLAAAHTERPGKQILTNAMFASYP